MARRIMSETYDLNTAAASVDGLTTKTIGLTTAATNFATTMTQAFSSSSASGQKFDDVLKSLATRMMSLGSNPTTGVASGLQGIVSGLTGGTGSVKPFAVGGIIGTPSYFPMAGGTGLAGEAGPEAIMPLQRAADGSLGVAAQGGGNVIHVQIATPDAESFRRSESYVTGQIARAVARGQRSL
jgi:phage-related minor tail protein